MDKIEVELDVKLDKFLTPIEKGEKIKVYSKDEKTFCYGIANGNVFAESEYKYNYATKQHKLVFYERCEVIRTQDQFKLGEIGRFLDEKRVKFVN